MRIAERIVPDYAEPAESAAFKEGVTYFSVQYLDGGLLTPEMEAIVFIGRDLADGDKGHFYFQDAGSYREGLRFGSNSRRGDVEAIFYRQIEGTTNHIFDFDRALDELLRCSTRRVRATGT